MPKPQRGPFGMVERTSLNYNKDMFFVYILQSKKCRRFYIGVTQDLKQRIENHNNGYTKSTKPYKPWKLIYNEKYESKYKAYKREYHLKHPKGWLEKKMIVEKYG